MCAIRVCVGDKSLVDKRERERERNGVSDKEEKKCTEDRNKPINIDPIRHEQTQECTLPFFFFLLIFFFFFFAHKNIFEEQ